MQKILSIGFALTLAMGGAAASARTHSSVGGTMPACAAGDPTVWENTSSKGKAYHLQGDKYYGNTKHGQYACKSAADAAGYHAAGATSGGATSAMPAAGASSAPAMSGMRPRHHHHHASAAGAASPMPAAT